MVICWEGLRKEGEGSLSVVGEIRRVGRIEGWGRRGRYEACGGLFRGL